MLKLSLLPSDITRRAYILLIVTITVPMIILAYLDLIGTKQRIYAEKERELIQIVTTLEQRLPTTYDDILRGENALSLSEDAKNRVLQKRLQPIVDELARQYPGYLLLYGTYSKAIVVPEGFNIEPTTTGKAVYQTKKMMTVVKPSLYWGGAKSLAVMYPLMINGEVFGHAVATTKLDDVQTALLLAGIRSVAVVFFLWICITIVMRYLMKYSFRVIAQNLQTISNQITAQDDDSKILKSFPELAPVLASVIELRENLINEKNKAQSIADSLGDQMKRESVLRKKIDEQMWMKTELADMALRSERIKTREELTAMLITKVARAVGASFGVIYQIQSEDSVESLTKIGTYASVQNELVGRQKLLIGEGLVGQCAKDKEPILIKNVPENYIRINSGLGYAPPKEIITIPALFAGEVHAVIELASFESFTTLHLEFLEQAAENIAVTLDWIGDRRRIEQLLKESQALTEELQVQSEELQMQQEELRNINEQLHDQHKRTEHQMKELQTVKNELVDKAHQLELGSKYKSEFLANMSHELRTPLNSMMVLSQVLAENTSEHLTDKEVSYANTIYQAGQDLLLLIDEILDLSKVESGTVLVMQTEILTREFIKSFDLKFRAAAEQKGLEFHIHIYDNVPSIFYSDELRLKQILTNLFSNAVKFTDNGSVTLTVAQQTNEKGQPEITFAVSDTGIGIAPGQQELVFEAFRQVDGTTKRRFGGTGLGLSISRKLAELLGGHFTLQSILHNGSTFTLHLPTNIVVQPTQEVACTVVPSGNDRYRQATVNTCAEPNKKETTTGKVQGDKGKILLVDDDMRNIYALTSVLEGMNLNVIVAENGREAVEIIDDQEDVGLVIMDLMMPEMDGYEAIQRIRQIPSRRDLPIIALTAKAMKCDREQCMQVGASDYICKPVNVEQLQALIKVWLSK